MKRAIWSAPIMWSVCLRATAVAFRAGAIHSASGVNSSAIKLASRVLKVFQALMTISLGFVLFILLLQVLSGSGPSYKKSASTSLAGIGPDHPKAFLLAAVYGKMSHAQF